ncbi:oligosaccharide flippase family protein [Bradyrhizobium paxllaeri]|uniref:oligosaccharide flippase family protein n=1 Tax=Bradyrhizobium paxllaeri TaxID=190148 RepID=UPI000810C611|nr:lipopolysaccharide biosynthesis protein [Bradyrhizobium paxllaeri]
MFESLVWKSVLTFIYRCSGALISFAFGVSFARMMSIEEYGTLVSLMSFAMIASTFGLVGQPLRVLREIPILAAQKDYTAIGSIVVQRVRLACLGSTVATGIALCMFVVAHGREGVFGRWEYSASVLLIVPLALIEMQSSVGRALGSINLALVPKDVLWRLFIILLGGALFATTGHPLKAADVFLIATGVLILLIVLQQIHVRHLAEGHRLFTMAVRQSKESIVGAFSTSGPFWVTSIATVLFGTIDIVIVSVFVGAEAAGYYYAANRIALLLDFFLGTFCIPAAPLMARLFDENRRSEITRVMSGATLAAFVGVLACVVALSLVGDTALMAFGQNFVRAHGVLMVLAIGMLLSVYFGVGSIALTMTGHQRAAMNIMVTTSAVGVVAMVGATWIFGIWGTAIVVSIVWVATKAWMAAYLYAAEGIDLTPTTTLLSIARRRATRMST